MYVLHLSTISINLHLTPTFILIEKKNPKCEMKSAPKNEH